MFGSACGSKSNFERMSLFPIAPLKFEMDKGVIFSTSMYLGVRHLVHGYLWVHHLVHGLSSGYVILSTAYSCVPMQG